jgi:hypothetical protein
MKRHSLLLIFAVVVSLLPMTAYCDFFTDVRNAYMPGEVTPLMIGETEAPIIEIEAHTPIPLGVAVILTEPFPSSLTLEQGNSLANMLAEKGWNVVISPFHLPMSTTNEQNETTTDSMTSATEEMPSSQLDSIHPRSNQLTGHLDFESTSTALSLQLNAINNYLQDRTGNECGCY